MLSENRVHLNLKIEQRKSVSVTGGDLSLFLLLRLLLLLKLGAAIQRVEILVGRRRADVDEVRVAGGGRGVGSAKHGVLTGALDARLLRLRRAKLHLFEFVHRRCEFLKQSAETQVRFKETDFWI